VALLERATCHERRSRFIDGVPGTECDDAEPSISVSFKEREEYIDVVVVVEHHEIEMAEAQYRSAGGNFGARLVSNE
jgi:hypothetical protein